MSLFREIALLKEQNKVVGFTASTFDLLHAGHVEMLEKARSMCDFLIVGILTDPTISRPDIKNPPIQTIYERYIQLQALDCVDKIIPFDTEEDLENMIKMIQPDLRFCGEEYKGTKHTGWGIPGVKIIYNDRKHTYSSTELRNRVKNGTN